MKDLNEVIQKLKRHLEHRNPISGVEFATDIIEAFQAISLRLAAIEQKDDARTA